MAWLWGLQFRNSVGKALWFGVWRIQATRMSAQPCFQSPLNFLLWTQILWQTPCLHKEIGLLQREWRLSEPGWRTALPASSVCPQCGQCCPQWAAHPSGKHWSPLRAPTGVEGARDRMGPNRQLARTELRSRSPSGDLSVSLGNRRKCLCPGRPRCSAEASLPL